VIGDHIGRYPLGGRLVFTSTDGCQVRHRNMMRRHFDPAVLAADLGALRWHDLRHTCAAMLIAQGHSLHEVKDQLGHSTIRVTSDRYGHLYPEAREAMAASLDRLYEASRVIPVSEGATVAHLKTQARP
jgi:integrase